MVTSCQTSNQSRENEPQRQETDLRTYACSEDSDQTEHSRNLISVFVARMKKFYIIAYPQCTQ